MNNGRATYNKAQCLECLDVIESRYRHDFVWCSCESLAVDGGSSHLKRNFKAGWVERSFPGINPGATLKAIETQISESNRPKYITNIDYITYMGSQAYGVSTKDSDIDLYGICLPPAEVLFPHLAGYVDNFDAQIPNFNNWQSQKQNLVIDDKKADVTIYSVISYIKLLVENNPNMLDSIYTNYATCVLDLGPVGSYLRQIRDSLLHKGAFHKFRGYAHSQKQKMLNKHPGEESSRHEGFKEMGFDVKAGYHSVRMLLECKQVLETGTIDLCKDSSTLKEIREYKWDANRILTFFNEIEPELDALYAKSDLPYSPDPKKSKKVLYNCLRISGQYKEKEIEFIKKGL